MSASDQDSSPGILGGTANSTSHLFDRNAFCERMIGSLRRECLDHIIAVHESGLRRVLQSFFAYYSQLRTQLSHDKDTPMHRPIQPPELGRVAGAPKSAGSSTGINAVQPYD